MHLLSSCEPKTETCLRVIAKAIIILVGMDTIMLTILQPWFSPHLVEQIYYVTLLLFLITMAAIQSSIIIVIVIQRLLNQSVVNIRTIIGTILDLSLARFCCTPEGDPYGRWSFTTGGYNMHNIQSLGRLSSFAYVIIQTYRTSLPKNYTYMDENWLSNILFGWIIEKNFSDNWQIQQVDSKFFSRKYLFTKIRLFLFFLWNKVRLLPLAFSSLGFCSLSFSLLAAC